MDAPQQGRDEMKTPALTLKNFKEAIFAHRTCRHASAPPEGLNSMIQTLKNTGLGAMRNMECFSTMIFLVCGKPGLDKPRPYRLDSKLPPIPCSGGALLELPAQNSDEPQNKPRPDQSRRGFFFLRRMTQKESS